MRHVEPTAPEAPAHREEERGPREGADFTSKLADLEELITAIADEATARQTPGSAAHSIAAGYLSDARDYVHRARAHLEHGISL